MTCDCGDVAALCLSSQPKIPHPGVEVLLQTKAQVPFDSFITALSKLFFWCFLPLDLANCQLLFAQFSKTIALPTPWGCCTVADCLAKFTHELVHQHRSCLLRPSA